MIGVTEYRLFFRSGAPRCLRVELLGRAATHYYGLVAIWHVSATGDPEPFAVVFYRQGSVRERKIDHRRAMNKVQHAADLGRVAEWQTLRT
jgi:hypothetical protein